ncbi:phosphate propanoyltransferase [Lysinibacillus pakistanensis]|uniref:Phosphate propanoyltransferase n=2 Tax=Lysinibacillus pakistanensis TaxID=759811 RepID=A0ABX6DGD0_9BACI|nr:phosphate propanoyltransferase [Lysinibacillus pakistanensis]
MNQQAIEQIVNEVIAELLHTKQEAPITQYDIPIGISARHIHLKQEHVEHLFGKGEQLTAKKMLSQPGQFAANETLMVVGPKGSISNVRVLGPARSLTQVEVSHTDAIALGIQPPIRESGNIAGSASCTLVGPKGSLYLHEGVIIAQAHIHMSPEEASELTVFDGEYVSIKTQGIRPVTFHHVKVRVSERYRLEMHIDTDEANAGFLKSGATGTLVKENKEELTYNSSQKTTIVQANEINERIITEKDLLAFQGQTIIVPRFTRFTALAMDAVVTLGITIEYKDEG